MADRLFGKLVLGVSSRSSVRNVATGSTITTSLVHRFVAGETLDDAIHAVHDIAARGLTVTLDNLGENTANVADADHATREVLEALDRLHAERVDAYISLKLTQLGLDVGEHVVLGNAARVIERAGLLGNFIRLDMEGSTYTARTVEIFKNLRAKYDNVGIVLQAYLYRTVLDAQALTAIGAKVRLCKGAYNEPAHISFRRKKDTDRNYVRIMEFLFDHGHEPAFATHDPDIIDRAIEYANASGIARDRFEFQMLYGVRRDLQESLASRGYRVRVYVPYGSQWYPYLTRRLAERPANLLSMLNSVVRERSL
jgi:proline dehydrogenase